MDITSSRRAFLAGSIATASILLAGCQSTAMQPVSADAAPALYTGTWSGHFINRQGTRYPVTFFLSGAGGQITGRGDIPDSTFDTSPTITGIYNGAASQMQSSSGFNYELTMSQAEDGSYWIKGAVTGSNTGRLELRRQ